MQSRESTGHSAIFLAFLTRDQTEIYEYSATDVVGFKYFSAQESEPAGLSERWAYFKVPDSSDTAMEICPYSDDKKMPTEPNKDIVRMQSIRRLTKVVSPR
jgi:hypothetical protein